MENGRRTDICTLCKDVLIDPVPLVCEHTFCKECVEKLLKFHYNGSATVVCPMRCDEQSRIAPDATASCLVTDLQSYINVDLSLTCTDTRAVCHWKTCERKICRFCLTCNVTYCSKCWDEHLLQCTLYTTLHTTLYTLQHIPVKYNYKKKEISVICVAHQTSADYMCLNCDYQFICVYCKHRTHKGHFVENALKSSICMKRSNLCGLFDDRERVGLEMSKLPLHDIKKCKETLKTELKNRKLRCLSDYMKLLNKEESKLLSEFQRQSSLFEAINEEHSNTLQNGKTSRAPVIEVSLSCSEKSSTSTNLGKLDVKLNEMSNHNAPLSNAPTVHAPISFHIQQTEFNTENYIDLRKEFEDCLSTERESSSEEETNSQLNPDAVPVFFPPTTVKPSNETQSQSDLNPEATPVFYCSSNGSQSNGVTLSSPDSPSDSSLSLFLARASACRIKWSPEQ